MCRAATAASSISYTNGHCHCAFDMFRGMCDLVYNRYNRYTICILKYEVSNHLYISGNDSFPGGACWSVMYRYLNKKSLKMGTCFKLGHAQHCHNFG